MDFSAPSPSKPASTTTSQITPPTPSTTHQRCAHHLKPPSRRIGDDRALPGRCQGVAHQRVGADPLPLGDDEIAFEVHGDARRYAQEREDGGGGVPREMK